MANLTPRGMVGRIYVCDLYALGLMLSLMIKRKSHYKSMGSIHPLGVASLDPQGHGWQDFGRGLLDIDTY